MTKTTESFPLHPTEVRFEVLMALNEYSYSKLGFTYLVQLSLRTEYVDLELVTLHAN